jgi:hypothetical protein
LQKTNPFSFGALATGPSFTNRRDELQELRSDMLNGQNVILYAPRRYGKSSLALKAAEQAVKQDKALVGYVDLMKTPSKERFAAALAKTIYDDLDSKAGALEQRTNRLFRGLRIRPVIEIDPEDGSLQFSFRASERKGEIDDTIEALLGKLEQIAQERRRRVVMIFDEFQEVLSLDRRLPNLMRAVFQTQPEVAHVYLGSKRHLMERLFNDRNKPFWRSAKQIEIGPLEKGELAKFVHARFEATGRSIDVPARNVLIEATNGHPYGTQELAYFTWELTPAGGEAQVKDVAQALDRVLLSESNHFAKLWEDAAHNQRLLLVALASEPTKGLYHEDYRAGHALPASGSIPNALKQLERDELVGRDEQGDYAIVEPFFAEWLKRERLGYGPAGAH